MNSLIKIKGLGTKNLDLLNNLGINSIEDLITYYPYRYNEIKIKDIHEVKNDENTIVQGKIDSVPMLRRFGKLNSLSFRVFVNNKIINTIIFNRAYMKQKLSPGNTITIFGKWNEVKNTLTASNILILPIKDGTIESIYHLTSGLNRKTLIKYINEALSLNVKIDDYIPDYLNEKYNFINKMEAVNKIHNPATLKEIKEAKLKLIYEELFVFMFKINYLKELNRISERKKIRKVVISEVDEFIRTLPFELTADQLKAIKNIYEDMTSEKKMNRMLQGDVGSGKTIVGVIASYINYLSKGQTALMAPTEILATQHYENIKNILIGTNMRIALLTGSMKKSEKDTINEELKNGEIDLLIGTHALISEYVEFKNLTFVITDEQHRFGVKQRTNLKNKGETPDILYMSATPIPRTFALTLYGDMDISNIKTKPGNRKEIKTLIKSNKEIKEVLGLMLDEIKKGRQVYVVSPLIEETEETDLTAVTDLKKKIDVAFNNKVKSEILHGKLSSADKERVMNNFKENKTNILISTTVVEVGVDIKNATMMVIFDAERFGLATLHQLRGRIGRNDYDSYCILVGSRSNKRLEVLESSNDGFYITEKDFEMRKEGDLFGVKQSGDMVFKIADLHKDYKILVQAKEDSKKFLQENYKNNFINYKNYSKIILELSNLE